MKNAALYAGGSLLLFLGCLFGALVSSSTRSDPALHELGPLLRKEAERLFVDFKNKNIIKHVQLTVIDRCSLDVSIVSVVRGGEYGFVSLDHLPPQFWLQSDGFMVNKFDQNHLFVSIQDWYILELERRPPGEKPEGPDRN
jgi:hypothetical protein